LSQATTLSSHRRLHRRAAADLLPLACHPAGERRHAMHRPSFFPALFAGFLLTVLTLAPSVGAA